MQLLHIGQGGRQHRRYRHGQQVRHPEIENGQESWTPYSFGFDNAVRYADADGRYPGPGDDVPTVARGFVEFCASAANLALSSWAYTTGSSTKIQAQVYETNISLGIDYARVPVGGLKQEAKSTALDVANVAINVMPAGRAGVGRALEQAAGKAGEAVIAQEVKTEVHAFGNATQPRPPRAGTDVEVNSQGTTPSQANAQWPKGASTTTHPKESGLTGHYHTLPKGTKLPGGLGIKADGINVGGPRAAGHHTIYPTRDMPHSDFQSKFLELPWLKGGKI